VVAVVVEVVAVVEVAAGKVVVEIGGERRGGPGWRGVLGAGAEVGVVGVDAEDGGGGEAGLADVVGVLVDGVVEEAGDAVERAECVGARGAERIGAGERRVSGRDRFHGFPPEVTVRAATDLGAA
jgi:hypothetical protein